MIVSTKALLYYFDYSFFYTNKAYVHQRLSALWDNIENHFKYVLPRDSPWLQKQL